MKNVFWLVVFLIPVSPAIKDILGFSGTLVDVSLILAPIIFFYFRPRPEPAAWALFGVYFFLSTVHGLATMPTFDLSVMAVYTQAIKVGLCIMFYTSLTHAFRTDTSYVEIASSALLWSCVFELAFSLYTYAAWAGLVWFPNPDFFALNSFDDRFSGVIGGMIFPRFFGTTHEPAPYGLFGLAALVFWVKFQNVRHRKAGIFFSSLIIVTSLSDQVFLGLLFLGLYLMAGKKGYRTLLICASIVCIAPLSFYLANNIGQKLADVEVSSASFGQSAGERLFYAKYLYDTVSVSSFNFLTGLGPGLFGYYLNKEYGFPTTTSTMSFPVDILASGGVILAVVTVYLFRRPYRGSPLLFSAMLTANLLQHDWKSPPFFFVLAILSCERFWKSNDCV
jgi:hypothetical protein